MTYLQALNKTIKFWKDRVKDGKDISMSMDDCFLCISQGYSYDKQGEAECIGEICLFFPQEKCWDVFLNDFRLSKYGFLDKEPRKAWAKEAVKYLENIKKNFQKE